MLNATVSQIIHSLRISNGIGELIIIDIEPTAWKQAEGSVCNFIIFPQVKMIKEMCLHLLEYPSSKSCDNLSRLLVQTLSESVYRHINGQDHTAKSIQLITETAKDERVNKVLSYLQNNFYHQITLHEVARKYGLSIRNMNRLFMKEFGLSPKEIIIKLRIEESLTLLTQNKKSLSEIAQDVGYSSQSEFSKAFKRIVGKTPSSMNR